ncbi:MAG TPA: hypothetical protein VGP72_06170 [Planctomycetota bacterium]
MAHRLIFALQHPPGLVRCGIVLFAALTGWLMTGALTRMPAAPESHERRVVIKLIKIPKPQPRANQPALASASTPPIAMQVSHALPPLARNVALASFGATVTGGVNPAALIDGNVTDYTGSTGYAHTAWAAVPTPSFVITLKDAQPLDHIAILLWDKDTRFYRYKLDVRPSETSDWLLLLDRTNDGEQCRNWQTIPFARQIVKQIRLTGTYNSSNDGFHVVEVEAYLGEPPWRPGMSPDAPNF